MTLRVLSIAAATGRVGYVFLIGGQLKDWRISEKASASPIDAKAMAAKWIEVLEPDLVITEETSLARRKGDHTRDLINAIAALAANLPVQDLRIRREQPFENKYDEAAALAVHYPELLPWVPRKRRFFDNEHRNTVLFEALALAEATGPDHNIKRAKKARE